MKEAAVTPHTVKINHFFHVAKVICKAVNAGISFGTCNGTERQLTIGNYVGQNKNR